ncbi:hypothetical protein Ssi03_73280 [Sphaerisporangium siamense]|uniref:Fibronectin type-III domain-containing protein n=1 Tax=Sphaerisporangium siamense TaxID=795645 RepID=A0A7W7GB69_9ACTN|nr:LamG-like jellyroll fold domain-containing protein [Sphaerisporangium siamense]MBB4703147.1 hypothetical protein [Sphaerisporangium siamense]GII89338.1 hypothetical protein Ssi03_73280 [Sphaerisporangium siamense]
MRPGTRRVALATALLLAGSLLTIPFTAQAEDRGAEPPAADPRASVVTLPRPDDPDAALRAAIARARDRNQAVEVTKEFTETSRTWAFPDGHLTTQSYTAPVQAERPGGGWAWLDATLVEKDGRLQPKMAKGEVRLSLGGDGPFATMALGTGRTFSLSWPTSLPRPRVEGNTATYVDAAGPAADLVVTALPTGFRHDVVLRRRPAGPVEIRVPVTATGADLKVTKSGGLSLATPEGRRLASAPAPLMWDADTAGRPGRQARVRARVEARRGGSELVLTPDPAWLADPATRYPVTVDPTTTLGVTQEVAVQSPNGQLGIAAQVGRHQLCSGCGGPNPVREDRLIRSLMAFDTTPIAGRQVVKATMQLTLRQAVAACTEFQGIIARRVTKAWKADDTSWGNQPSSTLEGRGSVNPCSLPGAAGSVWSWDLTEMTGQWARGLPNQGVILQLGAESPVPANLSEMFVFWPALVGTGPKPKLSVDWVLPPEIPVVTAESIDSVNGTDAIARSTNVKVHYTSRVPEATPLDYTVTVNDSTMRPPAAQLPGGEAAYYKLDESTGATAADSSGNRNNATLRGSYSRALGQLGQALQLSGAGYATAGKALLRTDRSYTVGAWVRLDDSTVDQTVFTQLGTYQPGLKLSYTASPDVPEFDQRWAFEVAQQDHPERYYPMPVWSTALAKTKQWTHVVVQYDAEAHKLRLFVDGVLAGDRDYTVTWNAGGAFEFGRGADGSLRGAIDDLHVYQRALTGEEIRALVGVPGTTTHNAVPSGQVLDKVFTLDNPASFKFVVKACRSGVTPPSCNESPAYRITSDAPMPPKDTETGMAEPTRPVLSGMVARPSDGRLTAKFFLYDSAGRPVGASPIGEVAAYSGQRASLNLPEGAVQPGSAYSWQMQACVEEVCTSKTAPVTFATPGTRPPDPEDPGRNLTLGKDSFVVKTARTDPTACDGAPCPVEDATTIRIGGTGAGKTAAVVAFKYGDLPEGVIVTVADLQLGTPVCGGGACPGDAVVTAVPLDKPVTSDTKASELAASAIPGKSYPLPIGSPRADIAEDAYSWLMLTTTHDDVITFGEAGQTQPSLALTYLPPRPPSEILNLSLQSGDGGAIASWGIPESNGGMALLDGYDVEVAAGDSVVKTLDVKDPVATIPGLTNGTDYTVRVRARTRLGSGNWVSAQVTPRPLPPVTPPSGSRGPCDTGQFKGAVEDWYKAQDAVLEGRAASVWDAPGSAPDGPLAARLSVFNESLVSERQAMAGSGLARTDSKVNVSDLIVQEAPGGMVRVTAGVERTWNLTRKDTALASGAAAGPLDSERFYTITIIMFHRCGPATYQDVLVEVEKDPTDFDGPPPSGGNIPKQLPGDGYGCNKDTKYCSILLEKSRALMKGMILHVQTVLTWRGTGLPQAATEVTGRHEGRIWVEQPLCVSRGRTKECKVIRDRLKMKLEVGTTVSWYGFSSPTVSWPPGATLTSEDRTASKITWSVDRGVRSFDYQPLSFSMECKWAHCNGGFTSIQQTMAATVQVVDLCGSRDGDLRCEHGYAVQGSSMWRPAFTLI